MSHTLLADIGGSTSRFAYANSGGRPERIVAFASDTVGGIEVILITNNGQAKDLA